MINVMLFISHIENKIYMIAFQSLIFINIYRYIILSKIGNYLEKI